MTLWTVASIFTRFQSVSKLFRDVVLGYLRVSAPGFFQCGLMGVP
jgi:hypothetical protein